MLVLEMRQHRSQPRLVGRQFNGAAAVVDGGGQGSGIPGFMSQLPAAVISLTEQLENATGVDLLKALRPGAVGDGHDGP